MAVLDLGTFVLRLRDFNKSILKGLLFLHLSCAWCKGVLPPKGTRVVVPDQAQGCHESHELEYFTLACYRKHQNDKGVYEDKARFPD